MWQLAVKCLYFVVEPLLVYQWLFKKVGVIFIYVEQD